MSDLTYRVLRFDELTVQRNGGEEIAKAIKANGAAGSQTLGVWLPMIGVSTNFVSVFTNWTGEPGKPQREPLAAGVQLVVEQPAHGVALVQPGAAALGVGLEVEWGDAGDHAVVPAARSARTCAR